MDNSQMMEAFQALQWQEAQEAGKRQDEKHKQDAEQWDCHKNIVTQKEETVFEMAC